MRWFDTPHVPHGWEAGVLYDATTKTLFCGDLFTRNGAYEATTDADIVGAGVSGRGHVPVRSRCTRQRQPPCAPSPTSTSTTLALMHGPAYTGDCKQALLELADDFDRRIAAASS